MKRRIYILFAVLASIMMVVVSAVPHHHYDGIACILKDLVDEEHRDQHRHEDSTGHHDTSKENCVAHGLYLSSPNRDCVVTNAPVTDLFADFLLQIKQASILPDTPIFDIKNSRFVELKMLLPELVCTSIHGLRAPPVI